MQQLGGTSALSDCPCRQWNFLDEIFFPSLVVNTLPNLVVGRVPSWAGPSRGWSSTTSHTHEGQSANQKYAL